MGRYLLSSGFTRQFQQESTCHFDVAAIPCQHLLVKTFGHNETDIRSFSQWLAPQLHDEAIIQGLQDKLANHDIPATQRLYAFVQETSQELAAQAKAEPYTAHYYNHLITLLHSFLDLIDAFTMHGLQMIACSTTVCSTAVNSQPENSEWVSKVYNVMEDYQYQIMEYFQHFELLLTKESAGTENNSRVLVKSYVAHYLDTILHHTEQLINNTDSILEMLHGWETALQNREEQELYN
ncbi:hypothetical protein HB364_21020 [Pseudoflavitalea sp. X16]|uniref:hypothetical protein n=1 Tax=Paraflavitalea devenefica TaxID=2716334 RepID=UPI00141EED3E|nr:hypothetical protein [Paraflavitalea devenefica]NII27578.1 hypothetical protein [Paraflavitalea devenefica]